ncbi:MAG: hypothetical protein ACPIOQ_09460, partial [Promethearchaeia archaeon]
MGSPAARGQGLRLMVLLLWAGCIGLASPDADVGPRPSQGGPVRGTEAPRQIGGRRPMGGQAWAS